MPFESTAQSQGFAALQHKLMDAFVRNVAKGGKSGKDKMNADSWIQLSAMQNLANNFRGGGNMNGGSNLFGMSSGPVSCSDSPFDMAGQCS